MSFNSVYFIFIALFVWLVSAIWLNVDAACHSAFCDAIGHLPVHGQVHNPIIDNIWYWVPLPSSSPPLKDISGPLLNKMSHWAKPRQGSLMVHTSCCMQCAAWKYNLLHVPIFLRLLIFKAGERNGSGRKSKLNSSNPQKYYVLFSTHLPLEIHVCSDISWQISCHKN